MLVIVNVKDERYIVNTLHVKMTCGDFGCTLWTDSGQYVVEIRYPEKKQALTKEQIKEITDYISMKRIAINDAIVVAIRTGKEFIDIDFKIPYEDKLFINLFMEH